MIGKDLFRRRFAIPAVLGLAFALLPAAGLAGPHGRGGFHGRGHGAGHGDGPGHMLRGLDLTEDQRETLHAMLTEHHEAMAPAMDRMRAAKEALAEAIHADRFDEVAIRDGASAVAAVELDLALSRAQMFQKVRGVLTPEQLAELDQRREQHRAMLDEWSADRQGLGPRGPHGRRGPGGYGRF